MSTGQTILPDPQSIDIEIAKIFMQNIDVVSSVRKFEGIDTYLELLELFYMDGEKKTAMLPELLQKQDIARYTIEVHGLKSAAANIGAATLSDLGRQHEEAGKADDGEWIHTHTDALMDSYRNVLSEISRVLTLQEYGRFAPRDEAGLPVLDDAQLSDRLLDALERLEEFEPKQAAQQVDELLAYALPEGLRTGLEQVQSLLKLFEDEEAEELLRRLHGEYHPQAR